MFILNAWFTVKFSLPAASPTVISFAKYDLRYFRDIQGPSSWNLDFIIAKDGESEPLAESSYSFFYTRSVSVELHLEAGNYIVLVCGIDKTLMTRLILVIFREDLILFLSEPK